MRTLIVTGGAGFIGSEFVRQVLRDEPETRIVNLDKLTYAGNLDSLSEFTGSSRHQFIQGDICDSSLVKTMLDQHSPRPRLFTLLRKAMWIDPLMARESFLKPMCLVRLHCFRRLADIGPGWLLRPRLDFDSCMSRPTKFMALWAILACLQKPPPMTHIPHILHQKQPVITL